jgi:ubiquinone/menaquinone biosynthesis C-methylase UbiE
MTANLEALYQPENRFKVPDAETAREIILTGWEGMSSEKRWRIETPWLQSVIRGVFPEPGMYLDYGCGIGRATLGLGDQKRWVNADFSEEMLEIAAQRSDSFDHFWLTPDDFAAREWRLDGAIAIYALQHIVDLRDALATIRNSLKSGAKFLVLNAYDRMLPDKNGGWWDDGLDVDAEIVKAGFEEVDQVPLDHFPVVRDHHFCKVYRKI